jgi:serine/threonine-protein kinase
MEFINGEEIHTYVKNNPEKINDIFLQTIQGFKYLENIEILHRDIRPQNILVSNEGIVKIIDFGFGKKINFGEDFDKSISLNWRFSPPLEFEEKLYDFKTEVFFVGKLFEELIKENQIEIFAYNEILINMIQPNHQNRISSFFEILRRIEGSENLELDFSSEEIETYRYFASSLTGIIGNLYQESEYKEDIELIISKLQEVYRDSMLEEYIQNNNKLISCFIKGNFSYVTRLQFQTFFLKDFINMFKGQPNEMKKIILNHLWNRFDAIERKEPVIPDDDLPF